MGGVAFLAGEIARLTSELRGGGIEAMQTVEVRRRTTVADIGMDDVAALRDRGFWLRYVPCWAGMDRWEQTVNLEVRHRGMSLDGWVTWGDRCRSPSAYGQAGLGRMLISECFIIVWAAGGLPVLLPDFATRPVEQALHYDSLSFHPLYLIGAAAQLMALESRERKGLDRQPSP